MSRLLYDFTQHKFLGLSLKQQHKKCAELLRSLYDDPGCQEKKGGNWELYQQFLQWMNDLPCDISSAKILADRYHWHLQQAQLFKKEHHLLPTIRKRDKEEGEAVWPIAIYLDRLRSAHNIGSMIRTVEAFALGNLYFSPEMPFMTHKQVQDTAMGTIPWVHCFQNIELSSLPRPIIALETSTNAISLYDFIFPFSFTLVMGNEEYGCSDETLKLADYLVEIPLRGRKNSLNVANAFALVAGEIARQRHVFLNRLFKNIEEVYDEKTK